MQGLGVLRGAVCLALVVTGEACAQRDPTDEERRWLRDEARRQSERAERDRRERLERFTLGDVQSAIDRGVAWLRERTTARARVYAGGGVRAVLVRELEVRAAAAAAVEVRAALSCARGAPRSGERARAWG